MNNDIVFGFANKFSGVVFIAGGIFVLIISCNRRPKNYNNFVYFNNLCHFIKLYKQNNRAKYKIMYKKNKVKRKLNVPAPKILDTRILGAVFIFKLI